MAERNIPHNPDSHAAYLGSWLKSLRDDKHEIFRAARDAHKAADLLIALEYYKSLEQALAHLDNPKFTIDRQYTLISASSNASKIENHKAAIEIEL